MSGNDKITRNELYQILHQREQQLVNLFRKELNEAVNGNKQLMVIEKSATRAAAQIIAKEVAPKLNRLDAFADEMRLNNQAETQIHESRLKAIGRSGGQIHRITSGRPNTIGEGFGSMGESMSDPGRKSNHTFEDLLVFTGEEKY